MKKQLSALLASCALLGAFQVHAIDTAFVELGGNALAYSVNYEHIFDDNQVGLRLGVGSLWGTDHSYLGMPLMVNKYWGDANNNHKFETGVGATYFVQGNRRVSYFSDRFRRDDLLVGTATLGYRYMPRDGMVFKVAFTPLFNDDAIVPMVGMSVGHTF